MTRQTDNRTFFGTYLQSNLAWLLLKIQNHVAKIHKLLKEQRRKDVMVHWSSLRGSHRMKDATDNEINQIISATKRNPADSALDFELLRNF